MLEVRLKGPSWYPTNYLNVYILPWRMPPNSLFSSESMYKPNWTDSCVLSKWLVTVVYGAIFANTGLIAGIRKWTAFEFVRPTKPSLLQPRLTVTLSRATYRAAWGRDSVSIIGAWCEIQWTQKHVKHCWAVWLDHTSELRKLVPSIFVVPLIEIVRQLRVVVTDIFTHVGDACAVTGDLRRVRWLSCQIIVLVWSVLDAYKSTDGQ